jgi:hypothetical protein
VRWGAHQAVKHHLPGPLALGYLAPKVGRACCREIRLFILYYGVLAPRAAWWAELVTASADAVNTADGESLTEPEGGADPVERSTRERRLQQGRHLLNSDRWPRGWVRGD